MGQQIIKQPNGKYALWSSIVTDFVLLDATPADIVDYMADNERENIERGVNRKVEMIERGEPAYFQFTMNWEEACAMAKECHGPRWKLPDGLDPPAAPGRRA